MLENLDSVDWDNLGSPYGSDVDVPELLRSLEIAPTTDDFIDIYSQLINTIAHQNTIYPITSHATHFIIQIMKSTTNSVRIGNHLAVLSELLRDTQYYTNSVAITASMPIAPSMFRNQLQLYDVIASNIDYYLELLDSEDTEIQTCVTYVLSFLVDHHSRLIPALEECIEQTNDQWLQASAIWAYAKLTQYSSENAKIYVEKLFKWIKTGSTFHMKYASALAHLMLYRAVPTSISNEKISIPDIVINTVVEGLESNMWTNMNKNTGKYLHYIYAEATPFDEVINIINNHCGHRPHTWIAIIQKMQLSPIKAHYFIREMVDITFSRSNTALSSQWENHNYLDISRKYEALEYKPKEYLNTYKLGKPLTEIQKLVLNIICNCDPFWEIKTNFFSFFYGLPDNREELHQLALQSHISFSFVLIRNI